MVTYRSACAALLAWIVFPSGVLASGFAINEQSARAIGMGGAFVAQADDPSAVFYNPAGIVQLENFQLSAGVSPILPKADFKSDTTDPLRNTTDGKTTGLKASIYWIPNFYATCKGSDQWAFGFGTFSNFGLGTDWPDDWEGRYTTGGTEAGLTTFSINPVVAFRPFKRLSLAAGPVMQYLDVTLKNKRFLSSSLPDANSELTGDDWEWGWNVGLLAWVTNTLRLGASYRSRVDHRITGGKLLLTNIPPALGGDRQQGAGADIELPSVLYLGAAWTHGPLTLEFDGQWTEWSTYEKLEVRLDDGSVSVSPKNWDDVWAYRFGAQYRLNEFIDLRAGIVYDPSPIPDATLDPMLPSGDRWLYTLGFGVHYNQWTVDFAYNFLDDESRTWDNAAGSAGPSGRLTGRFEDVYANIFALNVSCRF